MELLGLGLLAEAAELFGETKGLLERCCDLNWTSDDGKSLMKDALYKWNQTDTNDINPVLIKG